jgi:hypothetical protein
VAFLLQAAADSLLQQGYFPPCRVKKGKYDADFRCRDPSPDRAEVKGRQSNVCLSQEAPDTMFVASSGGPEVFQALLGDDQLLHLPLPGRQSGLLVPQPGILQSFLLPLKVGLTAVEASLTCAQGLKLSLEGDVVQLFPLVDLACTHSKVLLLLGDGAGLSHGRCVQLPRIGITLGDGLHL